MGPDWYDQARLAPRGDGRQRSSSWRCTAPSCSIGRPRGGRSLAGRVADAPSAGAPLHRWPTASLASPPPRWGRPQVGPPDEGAAAGPRTADRDRAVTLASRSDRGGVPHPRRVRGAGWARCVLGPLPARPRPRSSTTSPDTLGRRRSSPPAGGWRPVPAPQPPGISCRRDSHCRGRAGHRPATCGWCQPFARPARRLPRPPGGPASPPPPGPTLGGRGP